MRTQTSVLLLAAFLIVGWIRADAAQVSTKSPLCGDVSGKTAADRGNALTFCSKGVAKDTVVALIAMDSLLWIKVTRGMANDIRADRLQSEQLIKAWMKVWRQITGHKAVTVTVEWQDVEIVTGDTSILGVDRVTFK